jgi:hypothetical protein
MVMLMHSFLKIVRSPDVKRLVCALKNVSEEARQDYFDFRAAFAACLIASRFLVFLERDVLFLMSVANRFAMKGV